EVERCSLSDAEAALDASSKRAPDFRRSDQVGAGKFSQAGDFLGSVLQNSRRAHNGISSCRRSHGNVLALHLWAICNVTHDQTGIRYALKGGAKAPHSKPSCYHDSPPKQRL